MEVPIIEAAAALQVSTQTIRRRLTKGLIKGYKRETPQGFVWMVEMADPGKGETDDANHANHANSTALVTELKDRIDNLEGQLTIRAGEISELHRLLAQNALNAVPTRPWWQFWR